jgi:hypothetical protein
MARPTCSSRCATEDGLQQGRRDNVHVNDGTSQWTTFVCPPCKGWHGHFTEERKHVDEPIEVVMWTINTQLLSNELCCAITITT